MDEFINSYYEHKELMKELKYLEIGSSPKTYGMAIQGKHRKLKKRNKGNNGRKK